MPGAQIGYPADLSNSSVRTLYQRPIVDKAPIKGAYRPKRWIRAILGAQAAPAGRAGAQIGYPADLSNSSVRTLYP